MHICKSLIPLRGAGLHLLQAEHPGNVLDDVPPLVSQDVANHERDIVKA
jgi:hypothetical protein